MKDEWRRVAIEGDSETMSRLVAAGENVDARDRYGQTALMLAASHGREGSWAPCWIAAPTLT